MVRILLEVFVLAFSLIFCGCPVCQDTVLIEQLNELCADVEWLFKSYEERIEYSLRPFLDDIKEELEAAEKLCEKVSDFVDSIERSEDKDKEEKIDEFLEKNLVQGIEEENIIEVRDKVKEKEKVQEILNDLNVAYQRNSEFVEGEYNREKANEEAKKKSINSIVFSIYIAKNKLNEKKNEEQEFISELKNLYGIEDGKVGGFAKEQRGKLAKKDGSKSYNIEELYEEFKKIYKRKIINTNVPIKDTELKEELAAFVKEVENFYYKKKDREQELKRRFLNDLYQISRDILRTFSLFTKNNNCEFIEILIETLLFTVFCIHFIELEEGSIPYPFVDDIKRELSCMQDLGEKQINGLIKDLKRESDLCNAYGQGLNFFAGFFVDLCLFNNQKIVEDGNKVKEDEIIKLFAFYLLRKWECDASVNYFHSCSLYDMRMLLALSKFIFLRRFKILREFKNSEDASAFFISLVSGMLLPYRLFSFGEDNECFDYILNLKLNLYIVKKKEINFYFNWVSFLHYKLLHILEKGERMDIWDAEDNLKYYGDGPYAKMIKVLFSSNQSFSKKNVMQDCNYEEFFNVSF